MDKSSLRYLAVGALLVAIGVALGWQVKPDRVVEIHRSVYTIPSTWQISPPCNDGREALTMNLIEGARR